MLDLGQEEKRAPVPVLHQHSGYEGVFRGFRPAELESVVVDQIRGLLQTPPVRERIAAVTGQKEDGYIEKRDKADPYWKAALNRFMIEFEERISD